jgi:hypothetical protein
MSDSHHCGSESESRCATLASRTEVRQSDMLDSLPRCARPAQVRYSGKSDWEPWARGRRTSGGPLHNAPQLGLGQRNKTSAKRSWVPQGPRDSGEAAPAAFLLAATGRGTSRRSCRTRHTLGLGQRDKSSAKRSWAP